MSRGGVVTMLSMVLNLLLTFWLINQYMSDIYLQNYVNSTIGQYYPFRVLTRDLIPHKSSAPPNAIYPPSFNTILSKELPFPLPPPLQRRTTHTPNTNPGPPAIL